MRLSPFIITFSDSQNNAIIILLMNTNAKTFYLGTNLKKMLWMFDIITKVINLYNVTNYQPYQQVTNSVTVYVLTAFVFKKNIIFCKKTYIYIEKVFIFTAIDLASRILLVSVSAPSRPLFKIFLCLEQYILRMMLYIICTRPESRGKTVSKELAADGGCSLHFLSITTTTKMVTKKN